MFGMLKGLIFFSLLVVAAFSCWLSLTPSLLLLPLHSRRVLRLRRWYIKCVSGLFLDFAAALLTLFGTKIIVYGNDNRILTDQGKVVISNHFTRIDWMFVGWCYNALTDSNSHCHVILKESLKSVPIFGWAMQFIPYVFLERNRAKDIPHISRAVSYLLSTSRRTSWLIFPEGTDLSSSNIEKNNHFARENKLTELHHVLYPKPAGLFTILEQYRGMPGSLHDITVGYIDHKLNKRSSEIGLVKGHFPREVHIFVDRFSFESLPNDRTEFAQWLKNRYLLKEKQLMLFKEVVNDTFAAGSGHFSCREGNEKAKQIGISPEMFVSDVSGVHHGNHHSHQNAEFFPYKIIGNSFQFSHNNNKNSKNDNNNNNSEISTENNNNNVNKSAANMNIPNSKLTLVAMMCTIAKLTALTAVIIFGLRNSIMFQFFVVIAVIVSVLGKVGNGWDNIELSLHSEVSRS